MDLQFLYNVYHIKTNIPKFNSSTSEEIFFFFRIYVGGKKWGNINTLDICWHRVSLYFNYRKYLCRIVLICQVLTRTEEKQQATRTKTTNGNAADAYHQRGRGHSLMRNNWRAVKFTGARRNDGKKNKHTHTHTERTANKLIEKLAVANRPTMACCRSLHLVMFFFRLLLNCSRLNFLNFSISYRICPLVHFFKTSMLSFFIWNNVYEKFTR